MALLDATNRARALAQFIRKEACPGLTKPDVSAALNATDQWIEDNQASYNTALPDPFKTTASMTLKNMLFMYVLMRRMGRLHAEEDG
jgi:hypothetical protein